MAVLAQLEPKAVFHYFEEICGIPHESSDTQAISDYLVAFAKERNLYVRQDTLGNVIIKKPATSGYEGGQCPCHATGTYGYGLREDRRQGD